MKVCFKIKKILGIIYVSLFSFALCGTLLNFKKSPIESRATFTGTWSVVDNQLTYSADYTVDSIVMTELTMSEGNVYSLGIEVYSISPTNGQKTLEESGHLEFTQGNYAEQPGTDENGDYYGYLNGFCSEIDGGSENVLFKVYVEFTQSQSVDTDVWFERDGYLYYRFEDQNEAQATIDSITYKLNMINPDVVLNVSFPSGSPNQSFTVGGAEFSPALDFDEDTYNYVEGTLTCYLPSAQETSELLLNNVSITIDKTIYDGWDYEDNNLVYKSTSFTVTETRQTSIVNTGERTYTLTYYVYIEGSQEPRTMSVNFSDADYEEIQGDGYYGELTGYCDGYQSNDPITIYARVEPTSSQSADYKNGWNYIEDDQNGNTLVWHNSEYPDATYALDIVRIKYVDKVAELIYEDTSGSVNDQPTATLTLEEYNQSTFILSGEMEINGDTQLIEISVADANSVDLYQLWRYEDMFFWREWDEEEEGAANIYLDNLGVSGGNACFYSYRDTEENYFVVTYTNAGVDLPTIYLTGASYTIGEGNDEGCYLITGGYSELSLDSATIRIPESYVKIIPEEGWVFDEEEHTFVYYEESEPCDITYNSGYLYVYGNEKNYAELTYTATLSNGNEIQETFTLYDARTMTIDGTEQKDKVEGTYNGKVIQVFLPNDVYDEFVPNFDYQGEFIYWYDEGVYSPCSFSNVIFNNYGDESDYNIVQLTLNGFDQTDGTTETELATIKEARVRQNTISGVWEGHDVSFTVSQIDIQNNITTGFNYLDGFKQLIYVDQADGIPQDVAILGAIYDGRDSSQATFEVSYEINGDQLQSGTFTLTNAYIIKQPYDDPYEPGEIYGVWSEIGDEGIYLTTPYISSVEAPYWTFEDGDFIYIDPENEEIYAEMVTCIYREDEAEMELNYYIFNPLDQDSYDTATLLITDVNSVVDYDAENKTPGSAKGRAAFVDEQNELTFKIYVAIDRPTPTIEFNSGWNYIENNIIWYDESLGTRETEVNSVKLFKEEQTQTIVSAEIQFAIYGLVREDPDYITYETIELTEVSILSEPDVEEQVPGVLAGYFATLSRRVEIEFFTYSVEIIKDETGGGDESPATATDEQQAEIIEFLPEITSETTEEEKQNKERAEQNVAQLSEKAAADILTAVTSTQDKIVAERDAKIAEATTQEEKDQANKEYQEKREIIETVATASVIVAVGQQTASEQGTKIDNCLPSDSGLESMDTTLNKFYETQMDYLLGKKVAPKTRRILRGNEPASASDNILSVSKDEYGKMIKFVDTAVSNMKNAALHIRKCSCVGMKNVVKSYISLVKIDTFRDFDETEANDKFVAAIYEATMLNMQQQVVEALKREHKPSNNAERERQFEEQLAACNDYKTFEQIVIEVLRLKYDSLEGEKLEYTDVDDFFEKIYMPIFRSWALDDPSINPTNITLEELTKATIETTTSKASKMTYRADISKQESVFLIAFGSALGVGIAASIALPLILKKRRSVK